MEKYVGTGLFTEDGKEIMTISYEYCVTHWKEYEKAFEEYLKLEKEKTSKKNNKQNKLCEDSEEYYAQIDNKHDKFFKDLFSDKRETAKFLNKYLNLKNKITEDEIEPYKTEYITSKYERKESDIIYKVKGRNIFFLIEQQSTVDSAMPYRIEEYRHKIMEQAIEKTKMYKKGYAYPKVIAIVLYTGKKKWNVPKTLEKIQDKFPEYDENKQTYNLVNINDYSTKELLEDDLIISKAMITEKSGNADEMAENIRLIVDKASENKKRGSDSNEEYLLMILEKFMLTGKARNVAKEMLEKIKSDKEENEMMNIERIMQETFIARENKGRAIGWNNCKKEMIIQMIKNNFNDETICKISKISAKELQEIKDSVNLKKKSNMVQ